MKQYVDNSGLKYPFCIDCDKNTYEIKEPVASMLTDSVRRKAELSVCEGKDDHHDGIKGSPGDFGSLCVACLEARIGRKLRRADISDLYFKYVDSKDPKERLKLSERLRERVAQKKRQ
jgi:hypothetical protein